MSLVIILCMCGIIPSNVVCFNVDVMFPFVYANPDTKSSNRSNYFGYAVAADSTKTPWILISAPRGNSTIYKRELEPGVVYKCDIPGKCEILNLTIAGWKNKKFESLVNNSWTGAVLDVKEEKALICAPRWKVQNQSRKKLYMFGMCYLMADFANEPCKLLPLINKEPVDYTFGVYNYGFGMYGMSASFSQTKEDTKILGGTPGTYNFDGSAVLFRNFKKILNGTSKTCKVNPVYSDEHYYAPSPQKNSRFLKGYLGYQISLGRFFSKSELYYVAGAPRAFDLYGAVLIFKIISDGNKIEEVWTQRGTQYGEYFGAALTVSDVTGDGFDDLIVGAPFYTEKCDEGRIYLYLGQPSTEGKLDHSDGLTFEGPVYKGRFGTVISSIGDINSDGFNDIAVGAPYEEDNHGAIYIFNGCKSGLKLRQHIKASQISHSLKGFGISIYHTHEICRSKKYLVIGSYISGNAVVLRSYPVITINVNQSSQIKQLQRGDKQFNFSICMTYKGSCAPKKIKFQRYVVLEPGFPVSTFEGRTSKFNDIVTLSVGNTTCETFDVILNKEDITVTEFKIDVSMQPYVTKNFSAETSPIFIDAFGNIEGKDDFCTECVEVDKSQSKISSTLKIPYTISCGDDNICDSDLEVHSEFFGKLDGQQFIIGSSNELQVTLFIKNTGDTSLMTFIYCYLPEPIKLSNGNRLCKEISTSSGIEVECQLDTALHDNSTVNITLNLNLSDLARSFLLNEGLSNLTISTYAVTSNKDLNQENNKHTNTLHFIAKADMKINGFSEKDPISYVSKDTVKFHHVYQVKKSGPSPVKETEIAIEIPLKWKKNNGDEVKFMEIYVPEAFQETYIIQCSSDIDLKKVEDQDRNQDSISGNMESVDGNEDKFDMFTSSNVTTKKNISAISLRRRKRQIDYKNVLSKSTYIPFPSETLYLNCSRSEVICGVIKCKSESFLTTLSLFKLRLSMDVNIASLGFLIKKRPILHITTSGSVSIIEPKILSQRRRENVTVSTSIIEDAPKKKVKMWVYSVSAVGGILLFLFLVMGLVKAGFFQRKLKEDLEKLMMADAANELFPGALVGIRSEETNKIELENVDTEEDESD